MDTEDSSEQIPVLEAVERVLDVVAEKRRPLPGQDGGGFQTHCAGSFVGGIVVVRADTLVTQVSHPRRLTPEERGRVLLFLVRLNYELHVGNVDMDVSDGELRVRTGTPMLGGRMISFDNALANATACLGVAERFFDTVFMVAEGALDPNAGLKHFFRR